MSYSKPDISTYSDLIDIDSVKSSNTRKSTKSMKSTDTTVRTNSWIFNKHNISVSYTPTNSIYFNIISNTTFVNYDNTIRECDLESGMDLDKFYTLIYNCFENKSEYEIEWEFEPGYLLIRFKAVLDGFFDIEENIKLREKVLSNDKVLTIKLTEMESRHEAEIIGLKKKIFDLENEPIIFAHNPGKFGDFLSYQPNTTEFDFTKADGFQWHGNYMDLNKLKKLNKIIISNSNFVYQRTINDIYSANNDLYCDHIPQNNVHFNYLSNIFNTPQIYLPTVQELEVGYKDGSSIPDALNSLPNLFKLTFVKFANNELNSFELVKAIGKLSHLIYFNCLNIQNLDQIKNWCDSKNIKLELN